MAHVVRPASVIVCLVLVCGAAPSTRLATQPANVAPETLDGCLSEERFIDTPFADVIQRIRDQSRIRIEVDWPTLHTFDIERTSPVTARYRGIKVSRALNLICRAVDGDDDDHRIYLIPAVDNRSVRLTSLAGLKATLVERDYPIESLVKSGRTKADIILSVEENVDAASWANTPDWIAVGHFGAITADPFRPVLHVRQTPENHRRISLTLDRLPPAQKWPESPQGSLALPHIDLTQPMKP